MIRNPRRFAIKLAVWLLCICCSACGLDTYGTVLSNSPVKASSDLSSVNFYPVAQGEEFEPDYLGMYIFYRLYGSEAKAEEELAAFNQRQQDEIIDGASVSSYLLAGTGLKYSAVRAEGSNSFFLQKDLHLQPDSLLSITWYEASDELKLTVEGTELSWNLNRNRNDGSVSFREKPVAGDSDFQRSDTDTEAVYLQLFAVSYAFSLSSSQLQQVYSKATFLTRIRLHE